MAKKIIDLSYLLAQKTIGKTQTLTYDTPPLRKDMCKSSQILGEKSLNK